MQNGNASRRDRQTSFAKANCGQDLSPEVVRDDDAD
jgi:hypothetical protein